MNQSLQQIEDEKFLREAIKEALRGQGLTHPNPIVGAVIVSDGKVLSRGWHRSAGQPHAEIEALNRLPDRAMARGATIYVTLEPCSTQGRTPPCTTSLIESGIRRVVYGTEDPNPSHAGRAMSLLQAVGIEVSSGLLAAECANLNSGWNKWISSGLPLVIAKAGMSLDGRIGSPPSRRWITSEEARADAMALRAKVGAILVGGETVRTDNPSLTVRGIRQDIQPWRAVWTKSGRIPKTSRILTHEDNARTLIYRNRTLRNVLEDLGRRGVECVLIEGGGRTHFEAFRNQLVDRVVLYLAPVVLGGNSACISGQTSLHYPRILLKNTSYRRIGPDLCMEGAVDYFH